MLARDRLDRSSIQPLYQQLASLLREELKECQPGSRFYGDDHLCELYQVSKPVVRSALTILVEEGLLRRQRAKGTFVEDFRADQLVPLSCVAVVAPLESYFPHASALRGLREVGAEHGYDLLLSEPPTSLFDAAAARRLLGGLLRKAEGVIWLSPHQEEVLQEMALPAELCQRLVFINAAFMEERISSVMADYHAGAFNACTHLMHLGYQRIGYVGGPTERLFSEVRLAAYRKALAVNGLIEPAGGVIDFLPVDDYMERLREVLVRFVEVKPFPEAIFAVTDYAAGELIHALHRQGRRVPEEVAVVGFDDRLGSNMRPPLTSVRLPYYEAGRTAMRLLVQQLKGERQSGGKQYIPCPLIVRESCGQELRGGKSSEHEQPARRYQP